MKNGASILSLYECAALSIKEWHDVTLDLVGKCETPEDAQLLHQKFELAEIAARVNNDAALETNFREGKLRLKIFLGLWSRGLEKAEAHGGKIRLPTDGKSKSEQLNHTGLSTTSAHRYEELIGPPDKQAQEIAKEATEHYLAKQREKREPGTMHGLKDAVKTAVITALGPPPTRTKATELSHEDKANRVWNAWMMDIDRLEPELAANGEDKQFAQEEFNRSEKAISLLTRYQLQLTKKFHVTSQT